VKRFIEFYKVQTKLKKYKYVMKSFDT